MKSATINNDHRSIPVLQESRTNLVLAIFAGLLTLGVAIIFRHALHHSNPDITVYYGRWYQHIVTYGRWTSLEGSYANYSPPYLYILSLISLLTSKLSVVTAVKLAQLPGLLVMSFLFWNICRKLGCSKRRSLLAAWIVLVAPEVFQNTIGWGQCDVLHTTCLLLMLRLLLARRPGWAMFVFGVAIAFKLQAIFVGATIAALFFAGEVPLWSALWVPVGYVVMMIPSWLAGRPWKQLLLIYSQQYGLQPDIAKSVANPYQLIDHYSARHDLFYAVALHTAFVITLAAAACLVFYLSRSRSRLQGQSLILAMAASLLMMPFLLPKMHDRYFFAGDTLILLLATMRPKLLVPAALLQITAIYVAFPHLFRAGIEEPTSFFIVPVALQTIALLWVGKYLLNMKTIESFPSLPKPTHGEDQS